MVVKPIRNDEDHAAALRRIEELWDAPEGSEEYDELEVIATLVDDYEDTRWPIEAPDAVDVLHYVMDQRDLSASDLVPYIGQRGHVYDVLNRRRRLSLTMIQRLHKELGIPADLLVQPVRLVRDSTGSLSQDQAHEGPPPLEAPKPETVDPGKMRMGGSLFTAGFPPLPQLKHEPRNLYRSAAAHQRLDHGRLSAPLLNH